MVAYAKASGTSTAQTVAPATRSFRSHVTWYPRRLGASTLTLTSSVCRRAGSSVANR
jgi:hypothetical protein